MKLRMYLRGLGIGVAVTALLMGVTTTKANKIPDSEVIKRAEALGMVMEDNTVKGIVEEPKAEEPKVEDPVEEEPVEEEPVEEEPVEEEPVSEEPVAEEPVAEEPVEEIKEEPQTTETAVVTTGTFTIEIAGGSGSEKVSALLEKGGAIESAEDFDEYLCNNGYDHRITAGKHIIPAGSDYETIAKIITSK